MKRTIRWSLLMAVLGFILGLGFLVPLTPDDRREPASDPSPIAPPPFMMIAPQHVGEALPKVPRMFTTPVSTAGLLNPDRRPDVLFDVHTIANSRFAKNTDAWVQVDFRDDNTREDIVGFNYCDNYNYDAQRADTTLNRFDVAPSPKRFHCYSISQKQLLAGDELISTSFGPVLLLRSNDFDSKAGGTLTLVFAYRVALVGKNDYRAIDLKVKLDHGVVTIQGPGAIAFNWLDLTMSEALGIPNGVNSFDFKMDGSSVGAFDGKKFPKSKK